MELLIVTGLSGAGKTRVINALEDIGFYCVDNIPPALLGGFADLCYSPAAHHGRSAIVMDSRSGKMFRELPHALEELRCRHIPYRILFLEASAEVLLRRYKETRRDHPLASETVSLTEAIAQEREMLTPLRETANYVIDTSNLKPRALQRKLEQIVKTDGTEAPLRMEVLSFGFKRGLPRQADLVFDVRFLPNPFYMEELCRHTGLDADVRDFVMNHPVTQEFMDKVKDMLAFLLPHYQEEGKHRLVIAVGCTGGAHRSVAIAAALNDHLLSKGLDSTNINRDVDK